MEITLLFLPLVATFLLLTDFKDPVNRWGSLALLFVSLGGLYSLSDHYFKAVLTGIGCSELNCFLNELLVLALFKTPLCLFPPAMIMFAFNYYHSGSSWKRPPKPFPLLLSLIPVAITFLIPLDPGIAPSWRRFLIITNTWALPYLAIAGFYLYKSIASDSRSLETDRVLTVITIGIALLLYLAVVYLLPLYRYEIFEFNPHFVIGFLGLFSFFAYKYGFLGFRVSVGNIYLDNAIKTVGSGVSVLNHNIKDKLVAISASASEIIAASDHGQTLIEQITEDILAGTEEIGNVVERLHQYLGTVSINPTQENLWVIVNQALTFFEPQIKDLGVEVENNLPEKVMIWGDRFHLVETLKNILQNSLEAMMPGGSLQISLLRSKENISLLITDSGCGIPTQDLPHVLKPFYTTKAPDLHFGLGLSYGYNIMQLHGGLLEIENAENNGTTVFLKFPVKK